MARLLPVKRVSLDTEQSSALHRQELELREFAEANGHTIVEWVSDETVSGAINLDDRPSLGKWLKEPLLSEWDVIAFTTQDRITRDDIHWWIFVGKMLQWGKDLKVLDDPSLDISTPNGRMIAGAKATQAANYRQDISTKMTKARKWQRNERLWGGGWEPFGWRSEKFIGPDGKPRYRLVHDDEDSKTQTFDRVQEARDRILNGDAVNAIITDWNKRGVPTSYDAQRIRSGADPKGTRWESTTLTRILLGSFVLGRLEYKGKPVLEDGLPVQFGDPIITPAEQDRIRVLLESKGYGNKGRRNNNSPLMGVIYCACSRPLYSSRKHKKPYYRCASRSRNERCEFAYEWAAEFVHFVLEDLFLQDIGDVEIVDRKYVPGDNREPEIKALEEALNNLAGNLENLPPGSVAANTVIGKMAKHEADLARLKEMPSTPSGWEEKRTGKTYGQWWKENKDWHARGDLLRKTGIRLILAGNRNVPTMNMIVPSDIVQRVRQASTKTVDPNFLEDMERVFREVQASARESLSA